jgi:hypothetical protein
MAFPALATALIALTAELIIPTRLENKPIRFPTIPATTLSALPKVLTKSGANGLLQIQILF